MNSNSTLDQTDYTLLQELVEDGRIPWSELGRRVGLTAPAVATRVARLEESGIISGYRAVVDLSKLGRSTLVFLRIRIRDQRMENARKIIKGIPEIIECYRVTGEDCYIAKAAVESTSSLEGLVDRLMVIGDPITNIVLSTVIEGNSPKMVV